MDGANIACVCCRVALWLSSAVVILAAAGCAFAPTDEGVGVLGFKVGEAAGSAAAVGSAVSGIAALFGGPPGIAAALGGVATTVVGLFAAKRHADAKQERAKREGERAGWEEAAATYSAPPPGPGGVRDPVPGGSGGANPVAAGGNPAVTP